LGLFELGFSLSNLFELADENDLKRKPDAVYIYGMPPESAPSAEGNETVFFDDVKNDIFVASVPMKNEFAYFGYLKKMMLTLHNIIRMKDGYLPFHGAMVKITLRDRKPFSTVILGDTGAGKSESLEALRLMASDEIQDLIIVADDMGSFSLDDNGRLVGYGTEVGAFVRLDDLQSGYALGQIDRTIIMNPDKVNARVVLPVTRYEYIMEGTPVDCLLYANNYEQIDETHPVIERFREVDDALTVFRQGAVMSKGTTTTQGLVQTYFANIFGPTQFKEMHEELAKKYFGEMFKQEVYVGQMRTMLGIQGQEFTGPQHSAAALLDLIRRKAEPAE
jgi:energy-coupling factor transporter ATP-binding protein EcfA2